MTAVQNRQDPTAPANAHLRTAVQIALEARTRLASAKAVIDLASTDFELRHAEAFTELGQAKAAAELAEQQLRTLAEAHYDLTQEKKPVPGVEIKLVTEVEITDQAAAFAFAKTSGVCVMLDDKAYKGLAKVSQTPLPGATVTEVPKASIARDLAAAIAGGAQ